MPRRRWLWLAVPATAVVVSGAILATSALSPACGSGGAAIGCATQDLAPTDGVSVVTGVGHLTGVVRTVQGARLHEFEIEQVRVLAGPPRAQTVQGWLAAVPSPGPGLAPAQVPGLWAPDGRLLAYLPSAPEVLGETSTIRVHPVVDGDVVFSAAACGSAPASLRTVPFDGPLSEVPDSRSSTVVRCNGGFEASPLREVVRLLG